MRIVLLYLLLVGTVAGILYSAPVLRNFSIKHKRKVVFSLAVSAALVVLIFYMEQT